MSGTRQSLPIFKNDDFKNKNIQNTLKQIADKVEPRILSNLIENKSFEVISKLSESFDNTYKKYLTNKPQYKKSFESYLKTLKETVEPKFDISIDTNQFIKDFVSEVKKQTSDAPVYDNLIDNIISEAKVYNKPYFEVEDLLSAFSDVKVSVDYGTRTFYLYCTRNNQEETYKFDFYKDSKKFMDLCRTLLYYYEIQACGRDKVKIEQCKKAIKKYNDQEVKDALEYYDGNFLDRERIKAILNKYYNTSDIEKALKNAVKPIKEEEELEEQPAYAGSMIDYDKPSLDYIGSGEGNQAHGWGLYYAQSKDVADSYRISFVGKNKIIFKGKTYTYDDPEYHALYKLANRTISIDQIKQDYKENIEELKEDLYLAKKYNAKLGIEEYSKSLEKLEKEIKFFNSLSEKDAEEIRYGGGQVHQVDLPEDEYLLNEQEMLIDQSEYVQDIIYKINDELELGIEDSGIRGLRIYDLISDKLGSDEKASLYLDKAGIKGIVYDGRQDGRCYVIFNPDSVKVVDKLIKEQTAYAGAPKPFDKADSKLIGKGHNLFQHGFGFYFTTDKETADFYRKGHTLDGKTGGAIMTVELPEDKYFINEDNEEQSEYVYKRLVKLYNSKILPKEAVERNKKYNLDPISGTGREIYEEISDSVGGAKKASELLAKFGIKGITYISRTDGKCFVIFSPNDIKVIEKQDFSLKEQTAYAGSRENYDVPSLEKVGASSGFKYGWGLYYAKSLETAERYYKIYTNNNDISYKGKVYNKNKNSDVHFCLYMLKMGQSIEYILDRYGHDKKVAKLLKNMKPEDVKDIKILGGQIIKVDLPEDKYFMDWALPFDKQSDIVKKGILGLIDTFPKEVKGKLNGKDVSAQEYFMSLNGEDTYDVLKNFFKQDYQKASQELNRFGIKGIKYYDEGDGECFVIFNDEDVKVLDKLIKESFEDLQGSHSTDVYVSNSVYDIVNKIKSGNLGIHGIRICYDKSKNLFAYGDAYEDTHIDIFLTLCKNGYYPETFIQGNRLKSLSQEGTQYFNYNISQIKVVKGTLYNEGDDGYNSFDSFEIGDYTVYWRSEFAGDDSMDIRGTQFYEILSKDSPTMIGESKITDKTDTQIEVDGQWYHQRVIDNYLGDGTFDKLNIGDDIDLGKKEQPRQPKQQSEYKLNNNFWAWFGNSKVVDKDGNPLVCYHGSEFDIKKFDKGCSGATTGNNYAEVFYFTSSKESAIDYSVEATVRAHEGDYYDNDMEDEKSYYEYETEIRDKVRENPHINPCFLKIENPFIYDNHGEEFDYSKFYTIQMILQGRNDIDTSLFDDSIWEEIGDAFGYYDEDGEFHEDGRQYDGLIIKNLMDDIGDFKGNIDEYIVWNPNQIKSVNNKGNWSIASDNVNEALNEATELNNNFWKWFNGSKVVDVNGNPQVCYHGTKDNFSIFEKGQKNKYDAGYAGTGFYFTSSKDVAQDYADWKKGDNNPLVMSVYLNIKNPLYVKPNGSGIKPAIQKALGLDVDDYPFGMTKELSDLITKTAQEKGYDGVIYDSRQGDRIYVAFEPNQIKSINNNGNWSISSNNINEDLKEQVAYQGSAKDFDKHSTEFIGQGNTGMSHGWGLYFTSSKKEAEHYKNVALKYTALYNGQPITEKGAHFYVGDTDVDTMPNSEALWQLLSRVVHDGKNFPQGIKRALQYAKARVECGELSSGDLDYYKRELLSLKEQTKLAKNITFDAGMIYKVEIPDDEYLAKEEEYLTNQSPTVWKAIYKLYEDGYITKKDLKETIGRIYVVLANKLAKKNLYYGNYRLASEKMLEYGIKGIVADDTFEGKKTRVFCIFSENDVKILGKNSELKMVEQVNESVDSDTIFYHGSNAGNIKEWNTDNKFWSTDKEFAETYGKWVYSAKLDLGNVFNILEKEHFDWLLTQTGGVVSIPDENSDDDQDFEVCDYTQFIKWEDINFDNWECVEQYLDIIKTKFNSALVLEQGTKNYVVFDNSQIHLIADKPMVRNLVESISTDNINWQKIVDTYIKFQLEHYDCIEPDDTDYIADGVQDYKPEVIQQALKETGTDNLEDWAQKINSIPSNMGNASKELLNYYLMDMAQRVYDYILADFEDNYDIYRAITSNKELDGFVEDLKQNGTGNCWAKNFSGARQYYGDENTKYTYILKGEITDQNIDWTKTIALQMQDETEAEMRLKVNAPIHVSQIILGNEQKNVNLDLNTGSKYAYDHYQKYDLNESIYHATMLKDGTMFEVHQNPTKKEFWELLNRSEAKDLRGILGINEPILYVWDSYYGTHKQIFDSIIGKDWKEEDYVGCWFRKDDMGVFGFSKFTSDIKEKYYGKQPEKPMSKDKLDKIIADDDLGLLNEEIVSAQSNYGELYLVIYKNPTKKELSEDKYQQFRIVEDDYGNWYFGNAHDFVHQELFETLKDKGVEFVEWTDYNIGFDVMLYDNQTNTFIYRADIYENTEEETIKAKQEVLDNFKQILAQRYGSTFGNYKVCVSSSEEPWLDYEEAYFGNENQQINEDLEGYNRIAGFYWFDDGHWEMLKRKPEGVKELDPEDDVMDYCHLDPEGIFEDNKARFGIERLGRGTINCYIQAETKQKCLLAKKAIDKKFSDILINTYEIEWYNPETNRFDFQQLDEAYVQVDKPIGDTGMTYNADYIEFEPEMRFIDEYDVEWVVEKVDGDMVSLRSKNNQVKQISADDLNMDIFALDKMKPIFDKRFYSDSDVNR